MNRSSIWLPVLALIGAACLGLGIYSLLRKPAEVVVVQTPSPSPSPPLQSLSIPFMQYTYALFNEYGPGYDGPDTDHAIQVWMSKTGYITYALPLSEVVGKRASLRVRLSSELNKTTSTDNQYSSDITLLVNNQPQGMKTVIPDNNLGQEYEWSFPSNVLRKGNNEIRLQVGAGKNNGLCIYSPLEITFY